MATAERSRVEKVAVGFGAFYVVLGVVGFFFTGLGGARFFGLDPGQAILGLITLNGMHNVAHLGFGAILIVAAAIPASIGREDIARGAVIGVGAVYAIATIIGFAGAFTEFLNIPQGAGGLPDNLFHAVSAGFLLTAGFSRAEAGRTAGAAV